ncbi:heme-binding protein [Blastococcus sp. CT_GayMR20]|uniref:GlcG/HbpS family heme-binding protein n=1 Tax=Blastococcus sp. CT_GayMR20 TaxID=2559609 RepID=UPI00142FF69A|nr:heme-binding protein [Blastococcus sp. CT_GayMR20]
MPIDYGIVADVMRFAVEHGRERGFNVACGVVDPSGRPLGVLKHPDALWTTPDMALGKATLASAFREPTAPLFERWQRERPQYGVSIAAWGVGNGWFAVEGGVPVKVGDGGVVAAAIGISGGFPATIDAEIADVAVERMIALLGDSSQG